MPSVPPGFKTIASPQLHSLGMSTLYYNEDLQDGIDLDINIEKQILLRSLHMRNSNLQKQKDTLTAKRQCSKVQAKIHHLIQQEKERL